jgi:hypothetical protein
MNASGPVAARFTSSFPTPGAVWDRISIGVRCGPGGRGCLPPGAAIWAMLCWEPGPRADRLSRGRRLGRTPPIDLRRNATRLAGVTQPSPATPPDRGSDQLNQGHPPWVVSLLVLATADQSQRVWIQARQLEGWCPRRGGS